MLIGNACSFISMAEQPSIENFAVFSFGIRKTGFSVMALTGGLAGLASVLLSQVYYVAPFAGITPMVKGLSVALCGGLGSVAGAVIAAIMLGLNEALTSVVVGGQYVLMTQFGLIILILLWWVLGFIIMALVPLVIPESRQNGLLTAGAIFGIYAAINLIWMLIIGTAGIFSLASYAVVGAGAYGATYIAIQLGLPWFVMPFIGALIGLVFGVIIALPATRLDGFYYSLLTLGVVELCRVYVLQSKQLGNAAGGLYGGPGYIPEHWSEHPASARLLR
jgi:ABC-type branched-subunit amino acid transport system permease subunit